jgi:hypothetical protein
MRNVCVYDLRFSSGRWYVSWSPCQSVVLTKCSINHLSNYIPVSGDIRTCSCNVKKYGIIVYNEKYTSQATAIQINRLKNEVIKENFQHHVVLKTDQTCWNALRGTLIISVELSYSYWYGSHNFRDFFSGFWEHDSYPWNWEFQRSFVGKNSWLKFCSD